MSEQDAGAAALMGRYCDGHAEAFHALYRLLAPRVLAYLRGLLGERAAAEDVLQLTFMKVHEARATYVRGANPIPWIYTIAHRTCLDELRRRKSARVQLPRPGAALPDPHADITGRPVEVGADDGARAARLDETLAALDSLPPAQKQALLLTKIHGQSVVEAAAITGSTPGAIKLRAHRAYVSLRQLLSSRSKEERT